MNYHIRNLVGGIIIIIPLLYINAFVFEGIPALLVPVVSGLAVGYISRSSSEEEIE